MDRSNRDPDSVRDETMARELDAAIAALVAVLDEAMAVAAEGARPLAERAEQLARVGRSIPPVPFAPTVLLD